MPALASQPARPVCFVCSSSSGGGGGARWSSPTTRSVGRSAVAERAPNARITHHSFGGRSRARRARLAAIRGSLVLRVRGHVVRIRAPLFASLDSIAVISQQVGAVLRYMFLSLRRPPLRLIRTSEAGDSQPDGAPLGGHTLHPAPYPYARNRVTDVMRRRNAVVVVGGGPPPPAVV